MWIIEIAKIVNNYKTIGTIYKNTFFLEQLFLCSGPETSTGGHTLTLPVYLNSARSELLFTVRLPIAPGQEPHAFYERGVALLTSTALN